MYSFTYNAKIFQFKPEYSNTIFDIKNHYFANEQVFYIMIVNT